MKVEDRGGKGVAVGIQAEGHCKLDEMKNQR